MPDAGGNGTRRGPARPTEFRGKWRIRWIDHEGKRQSDVFESYAEAERELQARQVGADEVRAGRRLPSPAHHTFGELCDYWQKHRAQSKRSEKDDLSIIQKDLRPAFGGQRLRDVTVEAVDKFKRERAGLSPKAVSNHLRASRRHVPLVDVLLPTSKAWKLRCRRRPRVPESGRAHARTIPAATRFAALGKTVAHTGCCGVRFASVPA